MYGQLFKLRKKGKEKIYDHTFCCVFCPNKVPVPKPPNPELVVVAVLPNNPPPPADVVAVLPNRPPVAGVDDPNKPPPVVPNPVIH